MTKKTIIIYVTTILFIASILMINKRNNLELYDEYIQGSYNKKFEEHVVFYPQHQDDEVLWGGSAIINAINQCGKDNVYIVLVSDGSGVNVFKNKKYKNLSRKEKEELRNNEFRAALDKLGVKKENILILPDIEDKNGTHYNLMEEKIVMFEKELKSVTHVAHHYKYDDHIMHRKNGRVLKKLYDEGKVKKALYFIKPQYVKDIPQNNRVIYTAKTQDIAKTIRSSLEEYKIINKEHKQFGIGYISAHSYFDKLLRDPELKSVLSDK